MGWKAVIVREPAASTGSSTGRTRAGQMAAGTAHAQWVSQSTLCVRVCLYTGCMVV